MIVSVAVDVRAHTLFDYEADGPPGSLIGRRVRVPFRSKSEAGLVMEEKLSSDLPASKIRKVAEVYQDMPPLQPHMLDLIRFCAGYYHAPPGVAAATALPALFRRPSHTRLAQGWRLASDAAPAGKKAQEVIAFLQDGKCETAEVIKQNTGAGPSVLQRLRKSGVIERAYPLPPVADVPADKLPDLTPGQQAALDKASVGEQAYTPHLLFGETGSGKTEVYMRLADRALQQGGRALILTPEIHLTPQLEESFARRFPGRRVCVMHSALTDGERARRWLQSRMGMADIVLGTRSAVFAPQPDLRLIVVDEEHDDSYKQEEGLLFSARDVAVWRAKREKAALVCGSGTPALESYLNAQRKRYVLLRMASPARAGSKVDVALAEESGPLFHGMSQQFLDELGEALSTGGQALVFINRRGYSRALACRSCDWAAECDDCDCRMTWHKRRGRLICHRCGSSGPPPPACPECGTPLVPEGAGTQRIEEALNARFKPLSALRLDSDSLEQRGSFAALREKISSGEARLLVGTKIVGKGHNFPHLSFIGILNADAGLYSSDFRAEERLLMLLRQVIGRGTRNRRGCRVLVQTAKPDHPFYADLMSDDLDKCWKRLLLQRKRHNFPPFAHCALLRASALALPALAEFCKNARRQAMGVRPSDVTVWDAVPALAAKVAKRHQWQILVQSGRRSSLHRFLAAWRDRLPAAGKVRWSFDVDPIQI